MGVSIYVTCDHIADEFGSTCGRRQLYSTTDLDLVRRLARADRWLIDGHGRALCALHSGIPAPLGKLRIAGDQGRRCVETIAHTSGHEYRCWLSAGHEGEHLSHFLNGKEIRWGDRG